jgi:hypothetical protein
MWGKPAASHRRPAQNGENWIVSSDFPIERRSGENKKIKAEGGFVLF